MKNKIAKVILWIARIISSLFLAFVIFFVAAHIFGNSESDNGFQSNKEVYMFICFPISTIIGLSLAYKWEGLGGLISILGIIVLHIIQLRFQFSLLLVPIIPGLLYITYWAMTRTDSLSYSKPEKLKA